MTFHSGVGRLLMLAPLLTFTATASAQPAATDTLAPLRALVGRWQGSSDGQPGRATVERDYAELFGSRFIHVRNRSTYPPQEKNPKGEVHEDLGVFSFDAGRKRIVLRQFHVEGFVNQYVLEPTSASRTVVFTTEAIENIAPGWRARETYSFPGPNEFEEVFELAAPGKDFALYSRARFTRVRQEQNDAELSAALKPFGFLLGDWDAVPGPAGETGGFSFKSSVQGRVMVRTNYANYPASAGKPASRHDDLMVIAADGDIIRADYFDSEGHVIRYVARSPGARQAEFVSEPRSGEPRYRLRYRADADGMLHGEFEIAPPGKSDAFDRYLEWTATRRIGRD